MSLYEVSDVKPGRSFYLVDAQGLRSAPPMERIIGLGKAIADALSIRPLQIDIDNPAIVDGRLKVDKSMMRERFAVRLRRGSSSFRWKCSKSSREASTPC